MGNIIDVKPEASARNTSAQVNESDLTYNEPGITYNELGEVYGGVFGAQNTIPIVNLVINVKSANYAGRTDNQLYEPGITYNQTGYTYNQGFYGGIYGAGETVPLISLVNNIRPSIVFAGDFQGTASGDNGGQPIGLLLALTYP